jgi:hypothetical protein
MAEQALDWMRANTRDHPPVFLAEEIPGPILEELRSRDLTIRVPGGLIVLRNPIDESADVLRALLWPIVETLARRYAPAVVERDSAVRLHVGRTDPGPEIRIRQTGDTRWKEPLVSGVTLRIERGEVGRTEEIRVGEAAVPVDPAEIVLLTLPIQFLRGDGLRDVALWLKSLVVSRPHLIEAYRGNPRPVVLKRIEHIARDVGNEELADLLADVVASEQDVRIGRDRTGVGRELIVPRIVARSPTTHRPWLDRLRVMMQDSRETISEVLEQTLTREPPPEGDLSVPELVNAARAARSKDAYHSTSIEGYRLTSDEVSRLLAVAADASAIDDVRSRMAVMGYAAAFESLMSTFESRGRVSLAEDLVLGLYVDLFRPSVEAGIVTPAELRGWRRNPVFIRDTLYVPPRPEKVPAMIDLYFSELAPLERSGGREHPLLQGILAHLWFVWIHAFPDGNGRIARFLMNAAFLNAGLAWRTIRIEQRDEYFAALRDAQLHEQYAPFARFVAAIEPTLSAAET